MQPDGITTQPSPPTASHRKRLCHLPAEVAAQLWRVFTFVWQALKAALLPIALRNVPLLLERFLEHLGRWRDGYRERRAAVFNRHLQEIFG